LPSPYPKRGQSCRCPHDQPRHRWPRHLPLALLARCSCGRRRLHRRACVLGCGCSQVIWFDFEFGMTERRRMGGERREMESVAPACTGPPCTTSRRPSYRVPVLSVVVLPSCVHRHTETGAGQSKERKNLRISGRGFGERIRGRAVPNQRHMPHAAQESHAHRQKGTKHILSDYNDTMFKAKGTISLGSHHSQTPHTTHQHTDRATSPPLPLPPVPGFIPMHGGLA
jgi:hypothetical protein